MVSLPGIGRDDTDALCGEADGDIIFQVFYFGDAYARSRNNLREGDGRSCRNILMELTLIE
ncbi:MAG: hypothetical protein U5L09_03210 [Bacteroidales bacterium]|nr:hypothetical protein [Bacteroidales bacterium]